MKHATASRTIAMAAMAACAQEPPEPASEEISEGVALASPASSIAPRWVVDSLPRLSVGEMEGATDELFVLVGDAARLPDGGLVVLDAGAQELRFFDATGSLLGVGGRSGSGPGEFRGLLGVQVVPGDTVVAWDYSRRVLSYWSTTGEFLDERPTSHHTTIHEGELLPDLSIVIPRYAPFEQPSWGRYRPPAELLRYSNGETQNLGSFPYDEMFSGLRDAAPMPFRARSAVAAGGTPLRIAVADDSNVPEVRVYDESGVFLRDMQLHDTRKAVTQDLWEARVSSIRERFGGGPEFERKVADWERPDSTSAFSDLAIDAKGRLWVLREEDSMLLATVHADGEMTAELRLPALRQIFEIGDDYIVGLNRGELDVESVRTYGYNGD